jgi:hypothetical protein
VYAAKAETEEAIVHGTAFAPQPLKNSEPLEMSSPRGDKPSPAEQLIGFGDEILKHAKQIAQESEERLRKALSDTEQQDSISSDTRAELPPVS